MSKLKLEEIQGVLLSGYKSLEHCNYLLLQIQEPKDFRGFLKSLNFQDTKSRPEQICHNIAFTQSGLKKLGVEVTAKNGFSIDFIEGMDSEHKSRLLGDHGTSEPGHWEWGNSKHPVDCLLMVFTATEDKLADETKSLIASKSKYGFELVSTIESKPLGGKEHFGFQDGISQPKVKGFPPHKINEDINSLNPGEFILGYENSYDVKPLSPRIGDFDFGSDGTYLVMRQLEQDTTKFWRSMMEYAEQKKEQAVKIASKIVGRWPNGNPLTLFEEEGVSVSREEQNDFGFYKEDYHGFKCPFGSHIRRTNPRDGLDDQPEQSMDMINKHRIMRRGRPYGPPLVPDLNIDQLIEAEDDNKRGLVFICLNTDISRQFDFIQGHWVNNKKFNGFYNDVDPLMGSTTDEKGIEFEMQARPYRKRLMGVPEFVKVIGGAYFFLPSMSSIAYLSS